MAKQFKVELYIGYNWGDAGWTDDGGIPTRFATREEAQEEIDDVCHLMGYNRDDYRVVEVEENDQ